MPRLIGRQSNSSWYAGLFLIIALASLGYLEYVGVINLIPGIGRDSQLDNQQQLQLRR